MSSEYDYNRHPEEPEQNGQSAGGYQEAQDSGAYHYSGSGIPDNQSYGGQAQRPTENAYPRMDPMAGYNVTPPEIPKKSGRFSGKAIIAVALVCAVLGGAIGGVGVGMALKGDDDLDVVAETAEVSDSEGETDAEDEADAEDETVSGAINSTVIDVTTNSSTTEMTPKDVYENYVNAVVAISNESTTNIFGQATPTASSGSGFIISADGYIVTNNHVVEDADTLTVIMTSGEEYEAQIIGADSENDVALIKIDATDLPTVSVGSSAELEVGDMICAIGNPLGELTNTLTVGYVSALDREINESGTPINMFQTDCAINAGNSGGPIFDMHGNVVGITTAKYSSSSLSSSASIEGIGFCIPIDDAMSIVSDLLEYGYVKGRPYLGISVQNLSSSVTQYYNLPIGVYVYSVESGSAAETAGLLGGDIITAVDGTEITTVTEFKTLLKDYAPGDTATLTVYRSDGGQTLELSVTFDEMGSTTGEEETEDSPEEEAENQQGQQNQQWFFGFNNIP